MNLIPWRSESGGLSTLRREMDHLLENFFANGFEPLSKLGGWGPDVDVSESAENVVVKAEIPGVDPKDVEISLSDNTLSLKGEKREEKEEKGKTFHRVERNYGSFARSILLPAPVDASKVAAESKDGILTITMPKTEKAKAKRIDIKVK